MYMYQETYQFEEMILTTWYIGNESYTRGWFGFI